MAESATSSVSPLARGFYPEPQPNEPAGPDGDITVLVDSDGENAPDIVDGAGKMELDDGGVVIDFNPKPKNKKTDPSDHDANLAEDIDDGELQRIAADLMRAIESDDESRREWLETRAKGIDLLGFKIEDPKTGEGATASENQNMSTVRHPLLPEAVIRFQSNASAELLPAGGPVKVRNDRPSAPIGETDAPVPGGTGASPAGLGHNGGPTLDGNASPLPPTVDGDDLAEALEKDLNHYLTVVDKGYRSDTDRMLFMVGFGGCAFKKVYNDPIRRMPISRSVDAADLIVSNTANDIEDAGRITHRILMRKSTLIRMQIAGVYRKVSTLTMPQFQPTAVDERIATTQGFNPKPQRPEDQPYTIYECYVELDIRGFEHCDEEGDPTGLELPYRVTIEKDSRQILEVRRNWNEDDENCLAKRVFVKYPFVPALGFYEIGLLQMLGNAETALTAAWRLMIDSGMFACFPGFLYGETAGRQMTNEFRVPPGGGVKIQVGNKSIGDVVMPLPYKPLDAAFPAFMKNVEQMAQRVGGTAELPVSEGRQDAPVGTTLALIEQATKMLAAVHVRLHAAQSEEFQLLKERFRDDPEALWRHNKKPARKWEVAEFLSALDDCDIVPAADPNTPSRMHRLIAAQAVKMLQMQTPDLYDSAAVDSMILRMIGISNPNSLFNQNPAPPPQAPPGPPPDPAKMAKVALDTEKFKAEQQEKGEQRQSDAAEATQAESARLSEAKLESYDRAADRESRERISEMKLVADREKLTQQINQRTQQAWAPPL